MMGTFGLSISWPMLVLGMAIVWLSPALAQGLPVQEQAQTAPTAEQIIDHLKPKRRTRGLTLPLDGGAAEQQERQLIETVRAKSTRGLSVKERTELADVVKRKPSIDLDITFDYNSAEISTRAMPTLQALGQALQSSEFKEATFVVGGHTDGKGGETYNQSLSERRAQAVRKFLAERFGIGEARLIAVGYGKEQLKNAQNPLADENRRVQVVNLGK